MLADVDVGRLILLRLPAHGSRYAVGRAECKRGAHDASRRQAVPYSLQNSENKKARRSSSPGFSSAAGRRYIFCVLLLKFSISLRTALSVASVNSGRSFGKSTAPIPVDAPWSDWPIA